MPTVVITGASTGIGAATALALDDAGWTVFAGVRRAQDGDALRSRAGAALRPLHIDVTDAGTLATAAADVAEAVGEAGLDGLVCNAGIAVGGPLEFIDLADLRRQFEVNVVGAVATVQAFAPLVRAAHGRIVLTGSIGGRVTAPLLGPYSASKHALVAVAAALRTELRPWGIQVSLLEPGAVATPIWDKGGEMVRALQSALPERAHQLYGRALARMGPVVAAQEKAAVPARRVADAVQHALTAPRPRTRYLVGREARLTATMRGLLPDRAFDRLVLRMTGMPTAAD